MAGQQLKFRGLLLVLLAGCACTCWAALGFVGPSTSTRGAAILHSAAQGKDERIQSQSMHVSEEDVAESMSPLRLGSVFLSMVAALVVALAPAAEAQAARGGGRIGGTAPSMRRAPPPRSSTNVINKKTVVNEKTVVQAPPAAPVVAPAPVGVMAAPVIVAPGPSMGDVIVGSMVGNAVGSAIGGAITGGHSHGGPTATDRMLENQQRQDERQLDRQAAELDALKREVMELKAAKS